MVAAVFDKPLVLRRELAALRLGISLRTMDELIASGRIATVKIGRRRLISEQAIQDFIRKSEKASR